MPRTLQLKLSMGTKLDGVGGLEEHGSTIEAHSWVWGWSHCLEVAVEQHGRTGVQCSTLALPSFQW
jgi:hypothetical protein